MKTPHHLPAGLTAGALLITTAFLNGCGGGTLEAGLPASNTYAVATAFRNSLATSASYSVSGVASNGRTYTLQLSNQPLAAAVFPVTGINAARTRQTSSFTVDGITTVNTLDHYYDAFSGTPVGTVNLTDGTCTLISPNSVLPVLANVGAVGSLNTETDLAGCTAFSSVNLTVTSTWSIEAARGSDGEPFALLCENVTIPASSGYSAGSSATCLEVNANGSLGSRLRYSVVQAGSSPFSLTAANY